MDIVSYLEQFSGLLAGRVTHEGVVLKHGKRYALPAKPRPKSVRKGRYKMCFMNAYRLESFGFKYVEGFAIADIGIDLPVLHAWVVDGNGEVIETTWDKVGKAYYGIEFDADFVDKVLLEKGTYGVIDFSSPTFRKFACAE